MYCMLQFFGAFFRGLRETCMWWGCQLARLINNRFFFSFCLLPLLGNESPSVLLGSFFVFDSSNCNNDNILSFLPSHSYYYYYYYCGIVLVASKIIIDFIYDGSVIFCVLHIWSLYRHDMLAMHSIIIQKLIRVRHVKST